MHDALFAESEEQFRLMVENSDDILTIRDANGRIRYANASFQRVMGYHPSELIGATGFELLHPEDRLIVESALAEFWKTPGARGSIQYRARHANGSWVSLEVAAHNLLHHPSVRGVVINGRDITGREWQTGRTSSVAAPQTTCDPQTHSDVSSLRTTLPICAACKKVKNEAGSWQQIECYIRERSSIEFSHGMCPDCAGRWWDPNCGY
jgi:PAS domain S-box-containing protein